MANKQRYGLLLMGDPAQGVPLRKKIAAVGTPLMCEFAADACVIVAGALNREDAGIWLGYIYSETKPTVGSHVIAGSSEYVPTT